MSILERISKPNDIKDINKKEYDELAEEIREFLVEKVSDKGGHLASNLGSVELTMALHLCMDFPKDKLIFDVGHQAYTHKLLTGRREEFDHLREFGGLSGFPKTKESETDAFNTGHSSTSISAAMGYAVARDMRGTDEKVACVIGDGSLTGGMAYEAINCLAQHRTGCVIILNDNEMSIDKNVGGLSKYLNSIRVGAAYNELKEGVESSLLSTKVGTKVAKTIKHSKDTLKQFLVPGMFFEELGITYVGPIDGHDVDDLVSTIKSAFKLNKPIIIHVKTKKGKGYTLAEKHPDYFHGVAPFDKATGKLKTKKETSTYTDMFGRHMVELGAKYDNLTAISAAMSIGTGLNRFSQAYPDRFFDVGIAEQHAVTFAAGMAAAGMIPVVAIYSSFLQRAYDQILHDVCLQNLHVVFCIDRSGLVGQDGETHQGIYDVSYLSHLPNMTVLAPKNRTELIRIMDYAMEHNGPVAIKYPRGSASKELMEVDTPIRYGKSEVVFKGQDIAIYSCGHMMEEALKLYNLLLKDGKTPTLINARFINIIDEELLVDITKNHNTIVTIEENVSTGGFGQMLMSKVALNKATNIKHIDASIKTGQVEQGTIKELRQMLGINAESIYEKLYTEYTNDSRK
ncbi:MAG: 1-deoxy-D-xylulose-5-phosphate synthase [Lachnospiraceae bacterium]|nr:1-deoxy-D-xylulose-5-phosphate synthase [Lachnospiraceae bacterium]